MIMDDLCKLGLSKNESIVYLSLLKLGKVTTGPLVKSTGIPSSKIYGILDSLVGRGLAGYSMVSKVRWFSANRPQTLEYLLEKQESRLKDSRMLLSSILPSLNAEFESRKTNYSVEIFEGLRGIKSVYDFSLKLSKKGDYIYTVGYPLLASTLLNAYFKDYHKKISEKGIRAKIIYDYDTWFAKSRLPRPHAEQRYLPKGVHTPGFINVSGEYSAIMVVTENQKTAILIKNKEVAESYLQYFNLLWSVSHQTV